MSSFVSRRTVGAIASVFVLLSGAASRAQEGKDAEAVFKVQYLKNDKIAESATTKMAMNISMKLNLGGQTSTVKTEMEMTTQEAYVTRIVSVNEKSLIEKEVREYTKAESVTKTKATFGDQEQDIPPQKQTLPLEGRTFELERDEEATKVTPRGDKKDLPKAVYTALTLHEGAEGLFPDHPVHPGERWTIDGKKLRSWAGRRIQQLKLKDVSGSVECVLKEVKIVEGKRTARVEFTLDLEMTADLKAMAAGEEEEDKTQPKAKMDMSLRMKKGKGDFLVDLEQGISLAMELESEMEVEITQEIGGQEMGGKGKGSMQMSSKWKLEERKKD